MAAADPLEDLATQIRRDEAQVRQQTNTNTEAEKARPHGRNAPGNGLSTG